MKKKEVCLATRHQNEINKLLKIINSEEFYAWDDQEIRELINFINFLMGFDWAMRYEFLEGFSRLTMADLRRVVGKIKLPRRITWTLKPGYPNDLIFKRRKS